MNKLILTAVLFLSVTFGFSQNHQVSLKKDINSYIEHCKEFNYEELIEFVNPKVFEFLPKEDMKEALKNTFEMEGIHISLGEFTIQNISDSKIINGSEFVLVDYVMDMSMTLNDEEMQESAELITSAFNAQFGEENVTYDASNFSYNIHANKKMICEYIHDGWKFLDYDESHSYIAGMVFGSDLVDQLIEE